MTQRERQVLQLIEGNPLISQQEIAEKLGVTRSSVAVHISNLMKKGCIAGRGYVLRSGSYAAVVGGTNVDIGGRPFLPPVMQDSNPGKVSISMGGVGRNIAHNLALLDVEVHLLSAYADDANGERIAASCSELGIDLSHALHVPGGTTSTYLYLTDERGEMALAVSDMEICSRITPAYLASQMPLLQNAQLVVADANLPEESLRFLANNCTVPLFIDPVSTGKAGKLSGILDKIHTLKPNRMEAEMLSGVQIRTREDLEKAVDVLLDRGVHRLFISMGADGVYAAMGGERLILPNLAGNMVSTTGCGDAAMAAIAWAYLQGMDLRQTALASLAAGSIAMESKETINPAMSVSALRSRMNQA